MFHIGRLTAGVVLIVVGAANAGCAPQVPPGDPSVSPTPSLPLVTLKALLEKLAAYRDRAFRVSGVLENAGTNYFTDQRLVLRDKDGRTVPVRAWLPMEMPKGLPDRPKGGPVMSDFLGKTVTLEATLVRGEMPRLGVVDYLKVDKATISEKP
jgi:hypothetical protein